MSYNFSRVGILVVEANTEMFRLFRDVLSMLNVPSRNILPAYSKEEAFERFCKSRFDLVITDWLPRSDQGIELTKSIRTRSPNPYVPVILTAGSVHYSRVIRARDAGISEYLVKPFTAEGLATRIARVIEHPKQFIMSETYHGPDRRSHQMLYQGNNRRLHAPRPEAPHAEKHYEPRGRH